LNSCRKAYKCARAYFITGHTVGNWHS
jgi:hypothetical protein